MRTRIALWIFLILIPLYSEAQFLTREDSLAAGLNPSTKNVIIAGYGEAKYSYDENYKTATSTLTRNVLFVGYRFSPRITFFSELEVADARVDKDGGEVAMEQCVIKFDLNRNHYFLGGLVIPRIGLMNENHLPITFNGNDRHILEQTLIPSTWRELGFCYYGNSNRISGLNWSAGIFNGLNGEKLEGGSGLSKARYEGNNASSSNLAVTASLLYYIHNFRIQASGYYGGSIGVTPRAADSLRLNTGGFNTPVGLTEMNIMYKHAGLSVKALGAYCTIPDAAKLNAAFALNTPSTMYGYLIEAGYNLLQTTKWKEKNLVVFIRYEGMDLMATVPENGIRDALYKQEYLIAGFTYFPTKGIALKFDWKHVQTGEPNPALLFNTSPNAPAYQSTNNFYQAGMAYSF